MRLPPIVFLIFPLCLNAIEAFGQVSTTTIMAYLDVTSSIPGLRSANSPSTEKTAVSAASAGSSAAADHSTAASGGSTAPCIVPPTTFGLPYSYSATPTTTISGGNSIARTDSSDGSGNSRGPYPPTATTADAWDATGTDLQTGLSTPSLPKAGTAIIVTADGPTSAGAGTFAGQVASAADPRLIHSGGFINAVDDVRFLVNSSAADNRTAIQTALTAGAGGWVYLRASSGPYISSPFDVPADTQVLCDLGTTLQQKAGTALRTNSFITLGSGATLMNCLVDGNSANQGATDSQGIAMPAGASNVSLMNVRIQNIAGIGVSLHNFGTDFQMIGGSLINTQRLGFYGLTDNGSTTTDIRVSGVKVDTTAVGTSYAGAGMQFSATSSSVVKRVIFSNNTLFINDPGTQDNHGISLFTSSGPDGLPGSTGFISDSQMIGNSVTGANTTNTNTTCYRVDGSGFGNSNIQVIANTGENCRELSIELIGSHLRAVGNTFTGSGATIVNGSATSSGLSDISLSDNEYYNGVSPQADVYVYPGPYNISNVHINGGGSTNSAGKGYFFGIGAGGSITKSSMSGVHVTSPRSNAILLYGTQDMDISDPDIDMTGSSVTDAAIFVSGSTTSRTHIYGGQITNSPADGIQEASTGAGNSIKSVTITGSAKDGLHISQASVSPEISNNTFNGNGGYGINLDGSPTGTVMGANTLTGNAGGELNYYLGVASFAIQSTFGSKTAPIPVAYLGTCGANQLGAMLPVNDAVLPTHGAVLTGGGPISFTIAYCDGSGSWKSY